MSASSALLLMLDFATTHERDSVLAVPNSELDHSGQENLIEKPSSVVNLVSEADVDSSQTDCYSAVHVTKHPHKERTIVPIYPTSDPFANQTSGKNPKWYRT